MAFGDDINTDRSQPSRGATFELAFYLVYPVLLGGAWAMDGQ